MNEIRDIDDAEEKIRNAFSFLFDKGFRVVDKMYYPRSFGNWAISLCSNECIVRFVQDKGKIDVTIGPPWVSPTSDESKHFFELHLLVDYLKKRPLTVLSPLQAQSVDAQLHDMKLLLLASYDEIILFFNANDFFQQEKEIRSLRIKMLKQVYPFVKFPNED